MSTLIKKIMVRSIQLQMDTGKTFDEAVEQYSKLTEADIAELRAEIEPSSVNNN